MSMLVGLVLVATLPVLPAPLVAPARAESVCPSPVPPGSVDGGELTQDAKRQAFAEVIGQSGSYGEYQFRLAGVSQQPVALLRTLAEAIAGIESDWLQYSTTTGLTLQGDLNPCDYGMMQINANSALPLFSLQPPLLADTRGNIAAGMSQLADKWNDSVTGPLPIINDGQAELALNWYYTLSSYNGGPQRPTEWAPRGWWVNNPTCNGTYDFCDQQDYRPSRPWETNPQSRDVKVNWLEGSAPKDFPYQERVLYNLAYPKRPDGTALWTVGGLDLLPVTGQGSYGLRPDDGLFITPDAASRAPNLLLFRHQGALAAPLPGQPYLGVSYDLPQSARVTIELLDKPAGGQVLATLLAQAARPPGWSNEALPLPADLPATTAYRIRAETGAPGDPTAAEGQYVQALAPVAAAYRLHLPLLQHRQSRGVGVRNGTFTERDPRSGLPAAWQSQALYGPGTVLTDVVQLDSGSLRIAAAGGGQVMLRQRLHVDAGQAGRYRLSVRYMLWSPGGAPSGLVRLRLVERTSGHALVDTSYGPADWTTGYADVMLAGDYELTVLVSFTEVEQAAWADLREVALAWLAGDGGCRARPTVPC